MRIITAEKQDNCLPGEWVFKYRFDGPWEKQGIEKLASLGKLTYHGDFPRPLFVLRCEEALVKGVEGDAEFRVFFARNSTAAEKEQFREKIAGIAGTV